LYSSITQQKKNHNLKFAIKTKCTKHQEDLFVRSGANSTRLFKLEERVKTKIICILGGWANSVVELNTCVGAMSSDQKHLFFNCDFGHTEMAIFKK
jgi:hypothetical protein